MSFDSAPGWDYIDDDNNTGFVEDDTMQTKGQVIISLLIGMLISITAFSAGGQTVMAVQVNIFGDGNPENGVEDSREQVLGGWKEGLGLSDQRRNAGTVKCDGKNRGTAMVVDTHEFADDLKGVVLASAAHVFYDLETNSPFEHCEFHFLALGELSAYRAKIDLNNVRMGDYDPVMATGSVEFGEGDWAFVYVPRPWRNFASGESTRLHDFFSIQLESFQQSGGEFSLIAFDSSLAVISTSRNCTVIESVHDDLGGGGWKGQLLDDCDSADGASGGGIVAVIEGQEYLVGIRNGSHWSEEEFPGSEYPLGPPDGSVWSRHTNTNFARGIDSYMINELEKFVKGLEKEEKYF